MGLNLQIAGHEWESGERSWTSTDTLLYALGVGAGAEDPLTELSFTTENSHGVEQQVLPTFGVSLSGPSNAPDIGDVDRATILHAEQAVTLHGAIPVAGTARTVSRVVGFYDKDPHALIVMEHTALDADSGRPLVESRTTIFVRGEGGFGGERGETQPWVVPDRAPDHIQIYPTRVDQALLYRLSGDRNPLHSDPWLAGRAGFDRPILHGLCTYGFTGRALLHAACDGDPVAFGSMSARFAAPVIPGEELAVHIWDEGGTCLFQTRVGDTVVLDRGVFSRKAA
jgi:acyl dehydratase